MRKLIQLPIAFLMMSSALFGAADPEPTSPKTEQTLEAQCSSPFRDNAILQQQIKLPVWGASLADAKVTVSFDGHHLPSHPSCHYLLLFQFRLLEDW
jgi:hypothetical protein